MSSHPLCIHDISRSFGTVEAIAQIRLDIRDREFLAIVGPSGCGKSTLLNLLSGFDAPTSGTIVRRGHTRMVYQQDGLFPWLTAGENIGLGLRHIEDPAERRKQLVELLAMIGMEESSGRYPHQLSGGMRQRVELARAVAGEADILLMDEPFSAVDYLTRLRLREELARLLQERPRTVVFVTHDIEEAVQLADRVIVLSDRPARVRFEHPLDIARPRSPTHPAVVQAVHRILSEMGLEPETDPGA